MPWFKDYDPEWDEVFQFEIDENLKKKLSSLEFVSEEKWPNTPIKSRNRSERNAERQRQKEETEDQGESVLGLNPKD